jgi:hypothetical protein
MHSIGMVTRTQFWTTINTLNSRIILRERDARNATLFGSIHRTPWQWIQTLVRTQNFLALIDKHFPSDHKLHEILNCNCAKVFYCAMCNMERILKSHNRNKNILQQHPHRLLMVVTATVTNPVRCRGDVRHPEWSTLQQERIKLYRDDRTNFQEEVLWTHLHIQPSGQRYPFLSWSLMISFDWNNRLTTPTS